MCWRLVKRTQVSARVGWLVVSLGLACRMRVAPVVQMAAGPWSEADSAGLEHSIGWSATRAVVAS